MPVRIPCLAAAVLLLAACQSAPGDSRPARTDTAAATVVRPDLAMPVPAGYCTLRDDTGPARARAARRLLDRPEDGNLVLLDAFARCVWLDDLARGGTADADRVGVAYLFQRAGQPLLVRDGMQERLLDSFERRIAAGELDRGPDDMAALSGLLGQGDDGARDGTAAPSARVWRVIGRDATGLDISIRIVQRRAAGPEMLRGALRLAVVRKHLVLVALIGRAAAVTEDEALDVVRELLPGSGGRGERI